IFAVLNIFIFTTLIWGHARALYVADLERVRTARRLAVQHSATRVLAETSTERDVIPIILKGICETLEWRAGLFWERDEKADKLKCVQTWPGEKEDAEGPNSGASPREDSVLIKFLKTSRNIPMARGQ